MRPAPLRPGAHVIEAASGNERASAAFEASYSRTLAKPPFTASRASAGWRIDWMTPGGGIQTTILFASGETAK